jgi:hypothetical protein
MVELKVFGSRHQVNYRYPSIMCPRVYLASSVENNVQCQYAKAPRSERLTRRHRYFPGSPTSQNGHFFFRSFRTLDLFSHKGGKGRGVASHR